MQLSERLSAIADLVTAGNRLADVGCDHGYLPVYLVLDHKIPCAIAMDVREGPLLRAKEHIVQYGVEAYIETRLSDGLAALKPGEADTLVVAGMGGPLMERILTKDLETAKSFQEMILQPQSDIPRFRRFIRENGWEIEKEEMVLEEGKFYPMMKAVPRKGAYVLWNAMEERFGKLLLKNRHPVLKKYLLREERISREILKNLSRSQSPEGKQRMEEIKEEERLICAALKEYES
ncbi:MAG TPA: class I SAM-dependent methyltransferase [Candidatus Blautia faecigallinarum]|uniref:Class I SAM-dependent methyltransferase n=1 Tax=Candidatus Blautia faecigallinarum TaxID=2838488 RepID=A0A9D2IUJ2_9FIRM|nr:class I SAM-dependent methyltransferase [Candidatus Blautia faecigallinarum]